MKPLRYVISIVTLSLLSLPGTLGFSQESPVAAAGDLKPGVVVEEVKKYWGAELTGLQPEDILLEWKRGDTTGKIESPFDLFQIELEQVPRGTVSLEGFRGANPRTWIMGCVPWGITARPNFSGNLISAYREYEELAKIVKVTEQQERQRILSAQVKTAPWLTSWLLWRTAEDLSTSRQWTSADRYYQQALDEARKASSTIRVYLLRSWAESFRRRGQWSYAEKYYQDAIAESQRASDNLLVVLNLNSLGMVARAYGNLAGAEEHYRNALSLGRKVSPGSLLVARILTGLGQVALDRGQIGLAEEYHSEALAISEGLTTDGLDVASSLSNLGLVAYERGDLEKAAGYHHQALLIREKLVPDSLDVADSLRNLGKVEYGRGHLDLADKYYGRALTIGESLAPDSLDVALSVNNLGIIAAVRGNLGQAEDYYQRAYAIRERLAPGSLDVARSLNNLGTIAQNHGNLGQAEDYYQRAYAIREKLAPGSLDVALNLDNLGLVAAIRGNLGQAEDYIQRALAIREKLTPGSLEVARNLDHLGLVAADRGNLGQAEDYYQRALAIQEKLAPASLAVASSLNNLGLLATNRSNLSLAEEYHRRALTIIEKLAPGSPDVAMGLNNLGIVVMEQGNLNQAEEYHRRALTIIEKLVPGSLHVTLSLNNLGTIARDRGDLSQAEGYYSRALAIQEKLAPGSLGVAHSLNDLAIVAQARGHLTRAEEYFRRALTIREKLSPDSADQAETLLGLANLSVQQGERDAAKQLYSHALDTLESQTARLGGSTDVRSGFRAKYRNYYREYIDLLTSQKQPELAFQVMERSRARGMLEILSAAHANIRNGVEPSLLQQEQSLQELIRAKSERRIRLLSEKNNAEQLGNLEKEISDFRAQYQEVEGRIRSTSPVYAALTQPKPLSAQEVQQLLDENTVLLEYSLGEDRSHVFVVTSSSLNVYELPKRTQVENAARRVHRLLTVWDRKHANTLQARNDKRREADLKMASAALSRIVLGPIAEQIKGKRLLIVSDGVLEYIPFAALPIPLPPNRSGAQTPLIAEHEIVNLPSASVLAELRQQMLKRQAAPKAVAVLADPVFDKDDERVRRTSIRTSDQPGSSLLMPNPDVIPAAPPIGIMNRSISDVQLRNGKQFYLPRLPFTRREAQKILAVTPAGQSMAALDFKANRATMFSPELAQYRIVHIATHGLIDSANPGFSGLVLSLVDERGTPQDGFLGLEDIYNLNMNADLVVLSACQTGLGKQIEGEGLIGMTRGFMYAGASRVLAALWNAEDEATAQLMAYFYKAMEQDHLSPAAALQQAQIHMWKQKRWRDPYYWAGFQMQGEWK